MYPPSEAAQPQRTARRRDPLAAAIGNASLLGVGYLLLRRWRLALGTGLVTVALVAVLATVAQALWFEIVVLAWWAGLILHGWYVAGGTEGSGQAVRRGHRFVALGVTVPMLLAVGLLRVDAAGIEQDIAEARREGDCLRATAAFDRLWAGHYVTSAPLVARNEDTAEACERLRKAAGNLETALTGDITALRTGFGRLYGVLEDLPGHRKMVKHVLAGFLERLPTADACATTAVTDWLGRQQATSDALSRADDVVARIAPTAIVGCADDLMAADRWKRARARYRQLLEEYPGSELAGDAATGVEQATLAIELAKVRDLLATSSTTPQPGYCSDPAGYGGAAPYDEDGLNPALMFGNDEYRAELPDDWLVRKATNAVLVICAEESEFGTPVETCSYEAPITLTGSSDVTFRKIAIPVRVYELRTGELVADTVVEIGGASCPKVVKWETHIATPIGLGPPSEMYVDPSTRDVRAAFKPLFGTP